MNATKLTGIGQYDAWLSLGNNAIGHIGAHHVAVGKAGIDMKPINTNKCLAEMDLLDAKTRQRAD